MEIFRYSTYPEILKGEQIPLEARMFAIIDMYDALTSNRPYHPGLPKKKAISYISEQSRLHFAPKVVEAFIKLIDKNKTPRDYATRSTTCFLRYFV